MKEKLNIDGLLNIVKLTHSFQQIKRLIHAAGEDRFENDAEHSFQTAFVAWYIIDKEKLSLNKEKVLMYALCHDIVEVFAGDVFFKRTKEEEEAKILSEKLALEKLTLMYPDFPELEQTIKAYEAKDDNESKFVYALDKMLPIFNNMLDNGRTWHFHNLTFEEIYEAKYLKVIHDPIINEYFIIIIEILKKNPELFPKR